MAGALRCRLNLASIFFFLIVQLGTCVRLSAKAWNFVFLHHIKIGAISSICLGLLNYHMYSNSCRGWQLPALTHGYAPFPSHYFHASSSILNEPLKTVKHQEDLNSYFDTNVLKHKVIDSNVPPVVHIVWCDVGPFTFSHYLSVLSAFKLIKPSVLNLYVIETPYRDADGYYQFLDDLERDLPPLLVKQLGSRKACTGTKSDKLKSFVSIIGHEGGIVVNGKTILVPSSSPDWLTNKFSIGQRASTKDPLVVVLQAGAFESLNQFNTLLASGVFFDCLETSGEIISPSARCSYLRDEIFPKDIYEGSSSVYSLLRWTAYGSVNKLVPQQAEIEIVPKIVHYVWLGKRQLKYFAYLSVMSSLHVLKADMVYVHGDVEPLGELWQEVKQNQKVRFIIHKFPTAVYSQPIIKFASHASDYLRGDLLLRYGGVYADWDVIFLKELPAHIRRYNTTANVDHPLTGAFPDVFNLGVLVAAPGAPFLRHFLESYRWYLDNHWSYNAIHMPYKVYEKIPQSLNVDRHLQVLCARHKCHATWLKDYKSENADHLDGKAFDWTKEAMAIHWTYPDPPAFESMSSLLKSKSEAAKIGRNVLRKAGIIT